MVSEKTKNIALAAIVIVMILAATLATRFVFLGKRPERQAGKASSSSGGQVLPPTAQNEPETTIKSQTIGRIVETGVGFLRIVSPAEAAAEKPVTEIKIVAQTEILKQARDGSAQAKITASDLDQGQKIFVSFHTQRVNKDGKSIIELIADNITILPEVADKKK